MAKESSFDIVSEFEFQELRNAVDQAKKEVQTRYDLKDALAEIELSEDIITLRSEDEMKLNSLREMLVKRVIARKLNPKILKFEETESSLGGKVKQVVTLIKAMDTETAKKVSKLIRDRFKNAKPTIQGESVRVFSKSKDDLQAVMQFLREQEDIEIPLVFNNYR
ncbi:YajQ family cyclic di-GMP-binding protein [bacterium (Candidatus Blackallbacteria) CG17_big_fil_post_rev_8_21_14_2_50_48_46]|uniref:Nucleotide-binding protein COW36_14900 n=1 Tax=bacterium (Candidatus Blackallbacteria) CG17_big_fil_post_rev_8_21_14_2_50_48_46 TaxID=2014261 RepID=A0A2M7G2X1_9BACT|nr:MAG: YajQ family cyclic di-GMP-binding protein [bacterium (Candidatus Blackallbacteria) CG18_big_fil_WC_8_21_14_2_50_49_26]PIW15999.1 MAG: YajQ family cyclic di-GMP-binding protein [bacterium (Candidatus Blackallbacteria) CG17_big_fil_post_rev_8_21_14_2_50_48_46]PIW50411.1 MAG: YajQ family cyclic di-GMP-binding protein [bacterium (Candidatus Blackallbacteria) CG13_big_fil_rev_8_21_14_2_50_49_14]